MEVDILKEERETLRKDTNQHLQTKDLLKQKSQENKDLLKRLEEKNVQLEKLSQSKTYKQNFYLKKLNEEAQQRLNKLEIENNESKEEVVYLKSKLKSSQTMQSNLKKQLNSERDKSKVVEQSLNLIDKDEDSESLRSDKKNGQFKDGVRLAYMELQGKAMVAASKCSLVVQIVGKHLFDKEFSLKDLPCTSTALNFADEAHHISKYQVVDSIRQSDFYTYGSDATSRQKKHFVERHVVLNNKSVLCIGFTEVASEDAKTLLDQTMELLDELSTIYCFSNQESEKNDIFKELVGKMQCLMSDRAAVNKLFNKKLAQFRQEFMKDEDLVTHFLYCNAHFLLGMSRAIEQAVKEIEDKIKDEDQNQLGRDEKGCFKKFASSSETALCRIVRTAADSLGPRGDEKSGSRAEWLAYCNMHGITSTFSSFRSNRFNNLFENAAATLHHRAHMNDFLSNACSHSNLKLQSVLSDVQDERIVSIVGAIALFNLTITQSYWNLMNSSKSYGEFPTYVKTLESTLLKFATEDLLEDADSWQPVFEDFPVEDQATRDYLKSVDCKADILRSSFKLIATKCLEVLRRQLCDFIAGGVYDEISPEVLQVLNMCPLTNLVGERLFGDLDYGMLRRRHATTHHHSTVIMWNHNKTAEWLCKLPKSEREAIMKSAMKNRSVLRNKHRDDTKKVQGQIKRKLEQNIQKKKEKYVKDAAFKASVLDAIIAQGGVCRTEEQLNKLYQTGTAECLKAQIRYRKIFLSQKSLKVSGTVKELYSSLLDSILAENSQTPVRKKRKDTNNEHDTDSDLGSGLDSESTDEESSS